MGALLQRSIRHRHRPTVEASTLRSVCPCREPVVPALEVAAVWMELEKRVVPEVET
jgi:hypothetical protein